MAETQAHKAVEKMALKYYPNRWNDEALAALVEAGKLTQAAYKRVTGSDYASSEE